VRSELAEAARRAVARYGSPLYLYDLERLRADARAIGQAFPDPWLRLYSLKANGLPNLVREIAAQGFGANCVTGGELSLAQRSGVSPALTALEGIGKSGADLLLSARMAARGEALLWLSVESPEEAAALAAALRRAGRGKRQDVLVRLNPAVAPETIGSLAVGGAGSKFGILSEELPAVIEAGGGADGPLRWRGLHLHVGSQLGAVDAWRAAFRLGLRLLELQRASLTDFDTLDAGGGFPVGPSAESVPAPARFAQEAAAELEHLPLTARPRRLAIEPGRAVVAGCGWVIGRVLHVRPRQVPIVVLDAGMTELIRPALYGALHPLRALTSRGRPIDTARAAQTTVRVDGPVCESTDTLGSASLPDLERGDVVAIGEAGAYASAMASTYNGRPRPPEVAWDGERLVLLRRRGTTHSLP
jgi:diaminopimelate decarboxylase